MAYPMKAYKGRGMEGGVARWYDKITRRDMAEFVALAARIAAQVPTSGKVLEVAPGPGFLAIEIAPQRAFISAIVPLPRPRPVVNAIPSGRPRHRIAPLGEEARGSLSSLFGALLKTTH